MRIDLRVKHGVETRRLAADLFADGLGCAAAEIFSRAPNGCGHRQMANPFAKAGKVLQLIQARADKGQGGSRQRAARSYLATTRRMARPHGSQITARNPAVAMPWTMSSGAPAA